MTGPLDKRDHYIQVFMGTTYQLPRFDTVGELKSWLERIAEDLPDPELEISEVTLHNNELEYVLKGGIVQ